jgi:hypothetical protein
MAIQHKDIQDLIDAIEKAGKQLEGLLLALDEALVRAQKRDPALGPELPNGEGIAGESSAGITGHGGTPPCGTCYLTHELGSYCLHCGPPGWHKWESR